MAGGDNIAMGVVDGNVAIDPEYLLGRTPTIFLFRMIPVSEQAKIPSIPITMDLSRVQAGIT
jgi:hypothetical protein